GRPLNRPPLAVTIPVAVPAGVGRRRVRPVTKEVSGADRGAGLGAGRPRLPQRLRPVSGAGDLGRIGRAHLPDRRVLGRQPGRTGGRGPLRPAHPRDGPVRWVRGGRRTGGGLPRPPPGRSAGRRSPGGSFRPGRRTTGRSVVPSPLPEVPGPVERPPAPLEL